MDINLFGFNYQGCFTDTGLVWQVVASNGPITVVLTVDEDDLEVDPVQTNVKVDHPQTAAIVLAAARWHRSTNKEG